MKETDEQRMTRVRDQIGKILAKEGLTFDVKMIPSINLAILPKKKDDPTSK